MIGTVTGELSFKTLAVTLSYPGALLDGRFFIIFETSSLVTEWNLNFTLSSSLMLVGCWFISWKISLHLLARAEAFLAAVGPTLV